MGLIRVLLAISVLITHSAPIFGLRFLNGDSAITCFYVISGFLMTLVLSEKYTSARTFYVNRVLRIYPPYFFAALFSLCIYIVFTNSKHDPVKVFFEAFDKESYLFIVWSVVSNLTLIGIDLTRYIQLNTADFSIKFPSFLYGGGGGGHNLLLVPQAWTLAIELQFYLLVPFLVRWRTRSLCVLAAVFFIGRIFIFYMLRRHGVPIDDAALFPLQIHYFLFGMIGYRAYKGFSALPLKQALKVRLAGCVYVLAIAMVLLGLKFLGGKERIVYDIFYVLFAASVPFQFFLTKNWKSDSRIGEFSYPIYLFHYGVMIGFLNYELDPWRGEAVLAVTLALSALYIYVLDRPVQKLRRKIRERAQ